MDTNIITEVLILGAAQDAGLPQLGCRCNNCQSVRSGTLDADTAASIALIDHSINKFWIVDATPDIRDQLEYLERQCPGYEMAGVILTHAHMGHYAGLMFLGRESINTTKIPVFCTDTMAEFLKNNAPWQQLVSLENIQLNIISSGHPFVLSEQITCSAQLVPHRAEYSDTLAISVFGQNKSLFFCPDIDRWETWHANIRDVVSLHDVSLVDATFFDANELPGRDMSKIPHPLVIDTLERLSGVTTEAVLIHINHTNPIYQDETIIAQVLSAGLNVAKRGMRWAL